GDVNYLLLFITAAVVLYSLVMASVGLVKRLFKIIQLYIFGSWTVATMPLDNGARFEEWRSQFLVQIFQVVGSIAAMFIYLTLVNIAGSELNALATSSASTTTQWVLRLGLLVIIIGGAFALNEGGQLIAGLIQKGAGQAEGMSAMQSNALMKGGLQLATGGLATAAVLAKGAASSASGRGNSLGSMAGSALLGNRGSGNNSGGNNAAMHEMANQSFGGGSNGPSQTAYTGKGGINPQASLSRQQLNLQNIANRSGALSQRQYQKAEKHALRDNYSGTAKSDLQEGQKRTKAEVATSTAGGIRKAAGFVKSHGIIGTMIAAPKKAITAPFNAIKGKAARDKVARMENPKYKSDQARKEFKSLTIQEKSGLSKKDQKHIRNYGFDEKTSVGQKRINEEKALIANSKNDSEDKKKD
ncbi:MAG: hypothetical protein FWE36_08690, partial [Erysipelotrichales bacterium]|nr:hypothetical protein [Erysipelotrichales bacterium]